MSEAEYIGVLRANGIIQLSGSRACPCRSIPRRTTAHDQPLPSGCAIGLRIDERRDGGHGAPRAAAAAGAAAAGWYCEGR